MSNFQKFSQRNFIASYIHIFTLSEDGRIFIKNGFYIALKIAKFIEKRIKFRSKLVKLLLKKVKDNCKGIYVQCTGRINNVDMARNDKLYLGSLPLQSINLSISYGLVVANTTKGLQSIKVWICK